MDRIEFNHGRIAWCCADSGITLHELAAETGVAEATLSKASAGERGLTYAQLKRIADYFGRGVLFFMEEGEADPDKVHTPAFRSIANQKPEIGNKLRRLIERAERQRDIYLDLLEDVDSEDVPTYDPPLLPGDLKQASLLVREWLGLKNQNTFDQYRSAIESKGILVFRSNGYHGQWQIAKDNPVLGFSLYDKNCPLIFVKKQYFETLQTFTLIHELSHVLLHKISSIDDDSDLHHSSGLEREANQFAGLVLVPDEYLKKIIMRDKPELADEFDYWLEPHRKAWGVSGEVIVRRMLDEGLLRAEDYEAYRRYRAGLRIPEQDAGGTRLYRHREPKHIFGDRFVRVVLDSLNAKNISLAKASSYLDGIKTRDIDSLKGFYVGV
ncbi:ImmA/IrrE family metallo-endopeptidase [Pseudomonas monteilii]|uniref:helix-turn-helix domain-containing protein n=1 Tax=Pseudomonas TaxID=286 RepID=UPI0007DD2931|nr:MULTISPECIES: ImmA/IrrE family metallo-endopeptidase [Pseudomonas]ANI33834.1 peptidase [Pseudomonas sp. JY-Q]MCE1020517.1 ImmA/IrrE family metallo-endopeptidase [Pseudomonas monteilii]MCE1037915.1 ImmA/IrrE family metallo-endopeptidase [Pseudomonas monteilii]MCE1089994.1 ImmA/IrrE family metallo-endopeptidase [Pseudomonas monteilii]MDH0705352.1 ImmA/IrrE family metallo-endopeptidase [Pseudomonas sp. GD03862]